MRERQTMAQEVPAHATALSKAISELCSKAIDPTGDLQRDAEMEAAILSALAGSLGMTIGLVAGSAGEHRVAELHEIAVTAMERAIPSGKELSALRRDVQRGRYLKRREEAGR